MTTACNCRRACAWLGGKPAAIFFGVGTSTTSALRAFECLLSHQNGFDACDGAAVSTGPSSLSSRAESNRPPHWSRSRWQSQAQHATPDPGVHGRTEDGDSFFLVLDHEPQSNLPSRFSMNFSRRQIGVSCASLLTMSCATIEGSHMPRGNIDGGARTITMVVSQAAVGWANYQRASLAPRARPGDAEGCGILSRWRHRNLAL